MHKTRFAAKTRPQEVDIACGLQGTFVLAIECKVTNDETNSVKRINDVLKRLPLGTITGEALFGLPHCLMAFWLRKMCRD